MSFTYYNYLNYLIVSCGQTVLCSVRKIIFQPYQDREKQFKFNIYYTYSQ